jgi:hypothetical protein
LSNDVGLMIRCRHHSWFLTKDMDVALLHLAVDHLQGEVSEPAIEREAARYLQPMGPAEGRGRYYKEGYLGE